MKLKTKDFYWLFLFIGILFNPLLVRSKLISNELISSVNIFLLFSYMMMLSRIICLKEGRIKICVNYRVIIFVLLAGINFLSNIKSTGDLVNAITAEVLLVLPLIIICGYERIKLDVSLFENGVRIFNVIITLIIFWGLINKFLGNTLNDHLLTYFEISDIEENYSRLWSIYGHPLYNTFLFLAYFSINYMTRTLFKKPINLIYLVITTALGVLLSASKVGLLIYIFLLILLTFSNVKFLVIELIAYFGLNKFGLFDSIIERFSNGSFTSNRIEKYIALSKMPAFKRYKMFYGYGTMYAFRVYNNILPGASAAFEIPILALCLDYGILYMLLFVGLTVVFPLVKFVKQRQWQLLFCYMAVVGFMNTFNATVIYGDYLGVYAVFIVLMLEISDLLDSGKVSVNN